MGESRVTGAGFGGALYMIDCGFPLMLLAGMEKNGKKRFSNKKSFRIQPYSNPNSSFSFMKYFTTILYYSY